MPFHVGAKLIINFDNIKILTKFALHIVCRSPTWACGGMLTY